MHPSFSELPGFSPALRPLAVTVGSPYFPQLLLSPSQPESFLHHSLPVSPIPQAHPRGKTIRPASATLITTAAPPLSVSVPSSSAAHSGLCKDLSTEVLSSVPPETSRQGLGSSSNFPTSTDAKFFYLLETFPSRCGQVLALPCCPAMPGPQTGSWCPPFPPPAKAALGKPGPAALAGTRCPPALLCTVPAAIAEPRGTDSRGGLSPASARAPVPLTGDVSRCPSGTGPSLPPPAAG